MKSIFLYSKNQLPLHLQKINAYLYNDSQTNNMYRLNIMPQCTIFVSQDVEEKPIMTLTKYDPIFHMIQMLYNQKKINLQDVPSYLQKRNWKIISSEQNFQNKAFYVFNRQKIFDFLEKKVELIEKYIDDKNPLERLKLIKLQDKSICADTISLLKNEINPDFINDFVRERYNVHQSRKVVPQQQQIQAIKPKPPAKGAKKAATSKQYEKPKNQQTLFGSWGKK